MVLYLIAGSHELDLKLKGHVAIRAKGKVHYDQHDFQIDAILEVSVSLGSDDPSSVVSVSVR